ncbi:ROK family protein [Falsibacillus albus]|uniref:ROK family protein n=1 Tax=Falsibacillus albus TaxID=2478915 RepID=A0A3L7JTH4_9BACI|nr:ROK family protein [Falsibacillus albus]
MKSFLPNDIKDENRKIVFEILLQNPELAKVEITEKTTMSFVTVSKIVSFFEQIKLLSVSGESRDGSGGLGRKRSVYRFNENSYVTIGVQHIGKKILAVLVNLHSEVISTYTLDTNVPFHSEAFFEVFVDIINKMKAEAEAKNATIVGVGVGVDGAINNRKKTIRMKIDESKEEDYPYEDIIQGLEEQIGLPIILENDVNASTIAEFANMDRFGNGPSDLVQIALGDGIGAGIMIDKKLHRGYNASAGELEYMCFDPEHINTPLSVGWLESRLNIDYLSKHFGFEVADIPEMSPADAEKCVDYISKHIALAITNIISLLDINQIIVSGKTIILFSNHKIVEKIKGYVNRLTGWDPNISASFSKQSTAVGAAILSLQREMSKVISG